MVARPAVGAARVRVHVPIGDGDAVVHDRRPAEAGCERVVVFGIDVAAHNAPRFAHVHFVGQVTVVGELVLRQAPLAVLGALGGGDRLIVLQEPNQAEAEVGVALEDFLARRPVALGVGVVLAGQNRRVHHRLAVRAGVRGDALAVVVQKFLAPVVRRRLGQHHAIGGLACHHRPQVIGLHRAIGGERTGRVNRALVRAVGPDIQPTLNRVARRLSAGDVGKHHAGVRLLEFRARLAADAIGHLRQRREVTLVGRVGEHRRAHADFLRAAVLAQGQSAQQCTLAPRRHWIVPQQQGDIFFTGNQPAELPLGNARLDEADRIMRLREAHALVFA